MTIRIEDSPRVVDLGSLETVGVLGPTLGYVTPGSGDGEAAPCVMRGEIPPDGAVGLHSHADPETFVVLSGAAEGLALAADGPRWVPIERGDVFHVPGGAKHAFRNPSDEPFVTIISTTARMGRFFREVARLIDEAAAGDDPDAALDVFAEVAERYGHWLAGPEENAAVDLASRR